MNTITIIKDTFLGVYNFLATVDYSAVMLFIMVATLTGLIWNLNKKDDVSFDLNDLFVDEKGKASTSRISAITALIISTWAFVHLTLADKLTEWYVLIYVGTWVLNKTTSKYLDKL